MNGNIDKLTTNLKKNPALSQGEFNQALLNIRYQLPDEHIDFLRFYNGASGFLSDDSWHLVLWSIDSLNKHNQEYDVDELLHR